MQRKSSDSSYKIGADIIRVIAGIGVVSVHISTIFVNYTPIFQTPSWWVANALDSVFRVTVPLFVMLSGMLLLNTQKTYNAVQFYSKRLKRILAPLIIWMAVFFLWRYLFWGQHFTPKQLIQHIYSLDVYYHLYFLFIIVGLYFITPLLRLFLKKYSLILQIFLTLLCLSIPVFISAHNHLQPHFRVGTNVFTIFLLYVGYYLAGVLLGSFQPKKAWYLLFTILFCAAAISTAALNFGQMQSVGWGQVIAHRPNLDRYFYDHFSFNVLLMSLSGFVALNTVPRFIPAISAKITPFFKSVSGYIFGIFLIHPMIMELLDRYFLPLKIQNIHSFFGVLMVIKIGIVFVISLLLVELIKKTPMRTYIFGE